VLIPQEFVIWFSKAQDGKLQPTERILPASYKPPLREFVTPQKNYGVTIVLSVMTPFHFSVFYFKHHPSIWVQESTSMVENLKERIQDC